MRAPAQIGPEVMSSKWLSFVELPSVPAAVPTSLRAGAGRGTYAALFASMCAYTSEFCNKNLAALRTSSETVGS